MKTILLLIVLAISPLCAQSPYNPNPAAQKQAEREALRQQRQREADERMYRQLILEYLDRIANRRR